MHTFRRAKPIAEREPLHIGQPWKEGSATRTKTLYEYKPSRKSPIHSKSMVSFVNVISDIDGAQPKARISKNGREIAGLITSPLKPSRKLVCTESEKQSFLEKWTNGPPPLTETHGHAIGKGETREFIRNQLDISVGAL